MKESVDSLNAVSIQGVTNDIKADYFSLKARCYYDLADFDEDKCYTTLYYNRANACIDSALTLYPYLPRLSRPPGARIPAIMD